ncbi:DhNV_038 [Dikerogammarus haemobaphes nudivirus]|nr:DhNV_038 [Dikerogammarus haemobaphes nudivirus]
MTSLKTSSNTLITQDKVEDIEDQNKRLKQFKPFLHLSGIPLLNHKLLNSFKQEAKNYNKIEDIKSEIEVEDEAEEYKKLLTRIELPTPIPLECNSKKTIILRKNLDLY